MLSDGTQIDYVDTGNGSGFKIWTEHQGNRILPATGLWSSQNDWQKTLTRAGTAFDTALTSSSLISEIAGRVCPPNVFLNHTNMLATGQCLYFDSGNPNQRLDAASPAQGGLQEMWKVKTGSAPGTDLSLAWEH